MANAHGREIDHTDLDADAAEERLLVHRDLLAHTLRWSHIAKVLHQSGRYKTARVLDIGCGCDRPLPRMLHTNRLLVEEYVGMDYNPLHKFKERDFGRMNVHFYGDAIFPRDVKLLGTQHYSIQGGPSHVRPTVIVSLECIEHIGTAHGIVYLKGMKKLAEAFDAEVILSTPCWNVTDTAANHVSEWKHSSLGTAMEDVGFAIEKNYGTFSSMRDYKQALFAKYGTGMEAFFKDMCEFWDSNVISNMFGTSFPHLARNSIWHLRPAKEGYVRKFPSWDTIPTPWTSADDWEEANKAHKG